MDKKYFVLIVIVVSALAVFILFNFQQPSISKISFTQENCFDYYKFGTPFFTSTNQDKEFYNAGDTITFFYSFKNSMDFPLDRAAVRVQIFYRGLSDIDRHEGDDLIDQFYVVRDLSMKPGDVYSNQFDWKIPSNANPGVYVANFYLVNDYKYNLAGLSFLPNSPGSSTLFNVNSPSSGMFYFDKTNTYVNNVKYKFRASPPTFEPNQEITIKTAIVNYGPARILNISYQVYKEDDLDQTYAIKSFEKIETLQLDANSTSQITYTVNNLPPDSYLFVLRASDGNQISILKIFIPVLGSKGRIIYSSLLDYPIRKGPSSGFICLTNVATPPNTESSVNGKITITLKDDSGNTIATGSHDVTLIGLVSGYKFTFNSPSEYRSLVLESSFSDSSGNIQDQKVAQYTYSKFLNITRNLDVKLLKNSINAGDTLSFTISFTTEFGEPIKGTFVVYVLDQSGRVLMVVPEKSINGVSEESITIPSGLSAGSYKLTVVEKNYQLTVSKNFSVQ